MMWYIDVTWARLGLIPHLLTQGLARDWRGMKRRKNFRSMSISHPLVVGFVLVTHLYVKMQAIKIMPNFFFFFKIDSVPSTLRTFVYSTLISTTLWMGKLGHRRKPLAQGQWQSWDLDSNACTLNPYSDENDSQKASSQRFQHITCKNSPQPRKCYLVFSIRLMRTLRLWEGQHRAVAEFSLLRQCLSTLPAEPSQLGQAGCVTRNRRSEESQSPLKYLWEYWLAQ